jgi:hypothetical protein
MPNDDTAPLHYFEIPAGQLSIGKVDTANNVIRDVCMITGGLEAKGHGLQVDATTLKQIHECSEKKAKVPVRLDHGSGIKDTDGYLTNFRIIGNKVTADWHLLENHAETPKMLEMAARQPETFGLSVAFHGDPETKDGKTVYLDEKTKAFYTLGDRGAKKFLQPKDTRHARCTAMASCDVVTAPAACPGGLFSARVDTTRFDMPEEAAPTQQEANPLDTILAKLEAMEARFTEHEDAIEQIISHLGGGEPDGDEEGGENTEMGARQPLTELSAQQYLDAKFNQFLEGVADQQEQQALQTQFEEMKAGLTTLTTKLSSAEAQVQALSEINKELRDSNGKLTAASSGGAINLFQANPGAAAPPAGMTEFEAEVQKTFNEFSANPEFKGDRRVISFQATKHVLATKPDLHAAHLKAKGARD